MPAVEFVGQSMDDPDNTPSNPSRLVNVYRENVGDGRKALKSVLGTEAFAQMDGVFLRAMEEINGRVYIAHGGKLWQMFETSAIESLGEVTNDAETTISGNNGSVCIVAGDSYYVWGGSTLSQPTAGAFSDFGSVTFFGQRTILTERGGRRVQWSDVADPSTLDALNFATTEARDDNNLRAMPFGGELWIFKEASIERWGQQTDGPAAISGAVHDVGLKGYNLLTKIQNGGFFVGSDNKAYLCAPGGQLKPVSTVAVETSISFEEPQACFYYQDEGHEFCVITFQNRPAWVFDLGMGEWHERAEGRNGAWRVAGCVEAYGHFFVGNLTGGIYKLTRNNADVGGPLYRTMVSRNFQRDGQRFRVSRLQFNGSVGKWQKDATLDQSPDALKAGTGEALQAGEGAALKAGDVTPADTYKCLMRFSQDRAKTFGSYKEKSLGARGEYETQITKRSIGQFRNFVVELSCAEPVDVVFEATAVLEVA